MFLFAYMQLNEGDLTKILDVGVVLGDMSVEELENFVFEVSRRVHSWGAAAGRCMLTSES